jgi:mannan endo-1,4-beta-mannosidase
MDGGYSDLQQPAGYSGGGGSYASDQETTGGYGGSSPGGGYTASQSSSSPYATPGAALASSITSGLGNGVNLQPSYAPSAHVDLGWALMLQQTKIRSVRIEIEPGQEKNAQRWIREAVSNHYTVIATYHKFTALGSDNATELMAAANWWVTNYATLRSSGAFAINLMNEWGSHGITAHDFATAYNQALQLLRTVYSGPVVIDLPGYGQEAQVAALAVSGRNNATIADRNVILSMHVYPEAWNSEKQRGLAAVDLDELAATGFGCMVGEFGDSGKTQTTKWQAIVAYAKQKGWPVFGWAWNGDGQGMNMVKPQYGSLPTGQHYTLTGYFNTIYNLL